MSYIKWYQDCGIDNFYENKTDNWSYGVSNNPVANYEQKNNISLSPTILRDKSYSSPPIATYNKSFDKPMKENLLNQQDNTESMVLANNANNLKELEQAVQSFKGCNLKQTAKNTVFGDGSPSADVMLIGEAPGANEDLEGIPFCGQSGKLLNNILKSIGYSRDMVYITNTVFWRPPANRRPSGEEIEICRPFVERHISLIKPKIIILVGSTAVESLLGHNISMHELRNNFYNYKNQYIEKDIKTAVIFHPSYLLRQPYKKKLMWFDMLKIKQLLESM